MFAFVFDSVSGGEWLVLLAVILIIVGPKNLPSAARKVGELIANRAADKGITEVVFDRGGYVYHGRVQELAEGAREGGLKF